MKILLGVPEYPPYHIGGGGEVFKKLAESYKKLGYEVVVVYGYYPTKSWREKIKEYTDENGIKFYQIPEIPYPKSMPFLRTVMPCNMNSRLRIKGIIKKEKPDAAHLHGYGLFFINQLSRILVKLKIKYIISLHGYPETQNGKNLLIRVFYSVYDTIFTKFTLKNATKITGVSDYITNNKKINKYRNKSVTVFNGINQEEYNEQCGNRELDIYQELNLKKGKDITIFSMGRLSKMKGFQLLIEKIRYFLDNGISLHYIIAGTDDGYLQELKELVDRNKIEDNVHIIGWKERKDIISFLHQCDMFAIPSLWDPCPIAAFEGMACTKYIITTEAGGIKEILLDYPYKININNIEFNEELLRIIVNKEFCVNYKIDLSKSSWLSVAQLYIPFLVSKQ